MKLPKRTENSHKGTYGKVINIAGSQNFTGAAYLSSISALKVGCGYITLASLPNVIATVAAQSPDIVFMPIAKAKNEVENYDAISIGCGLSINPGAVLMFKTILNELEQSNKPIVIDADGLNILSKIKSPKLPENIILTPHPKEAAKLLKTSVEKILMNTEYWAQKLSEIYECTTVLKSHHTVVCSKKMETYINTTGNSALSKAGSGDVLCGMISGFLAQKMKPYEAAKLAVYLHGRAGELAGQDLSEYSVLASDLLRYIPLAIRELAQ